jgi:hypothetical protein
LGVSVSNDPDQPPVHFHQPRRGDRRRGRRADRVLGVGLVAVAVAGGWHQSSRLQREVAGLRRSVQVAEQERRGLVAHVDAARRGSEAEQSLLEARIDELRWRDPEAGRAEPAVALASSLRDDLESTRARLAALEEERTAGQRVIREYGGGVCLIQASYAFYDETGRPLRDRPDTDASPAGAEASGAGSEAAAPIHTVDYYGTGFLVDAHGRVLTNRHVA